MGLVLQKQLVLLPLLQRFVPFFCVIKLSIKSFASLASPFISKVKIEPPPFGKYFLYWEASGKFPSLTEPNKSYHGISFTKAVGAAAFAAIWEIFFI